MCQGGCGAATPAARGGEARALVVVLPVAERPRGGGARPRCGVPSGCAEPLTGTLSPTVREAAPSAAAAGRQAAGWRHRRSRRRRRHRCGCRPLLPAASCLPVSVAAARWVGLATAAQHAPPPLRAVGLGGATTAAAWVAAAAPFHLIPPPQPPFAACAAARRRPQRRRRRRRPPRRPRLHLLPAAAAVAITTTTTAANIGPPGPRRGRGPSACHPAPTAQAEAASGCECSRRAASAAAPPAAAAATAAGAARGGGAPKRFKADGATPSSPLTSPSPAAAEARLTWLGVGDCVGGRQGSSPGGGVGATPRRPRTAVCTTAALHTGSARLPSPFPMGPLRGRPPWPPLSPPPPPPTLPPSPLPPRQVMEDDNRRHAWRPPPTHTTSHGRNCLASPQSEGEERPHNQSERKKRRPRLCAAGVHGHRLVPGGEERAHQERTPPPAASAAAAAHTTSPPNGRCFDGGGGGGDDLLSPADGRSSSTHQWTQGRGAGRPRWGRRAGRGRRRRCGSSAGQIKCRESP